MTSFHVAVILLIVCVAGCTAQYGGYAPKPKPAQSYGAPAHHAPAPTTYHQHVPVYRHGYDKEVHFAPCGALMLTGCGSDLVHVPCVPGHGDHSYGGHHGGY